MHTILILGVWVVVVVCISVVVVIVTPSTMHVPQTHTTHLARIILPRNVDVEQAPPLIGGCARSLGGSTALFLVFFVAVLVCRRLGCILCKKRAAYEVQLAATSGQSTASHLFCGLLLSWIGLTGTTLHNICMFLAFASTYATNETIVRLQAAGQTLMLSVQPNTTHVVRCH